jgi:Tfp pilus tip-associated adhesin PilY1
LDDEYIGTSVLNTANEDVREVPLKLVPSDGSVMCRADSVPYAKYIPELTRELTGMGDILNHSGKFGDLEYLNLHRTMIPYNELGEPRNKIKRIVSDLVGGGVCNNNGAVCTNDGNLPCESDTSGTAGTCNTYSLCDDPNFQNLIESVSPGSGADADSCKLALNLLVGTFISGAKFATIDPALGRFDSDTGYSIFIGLLRITYEFGDPAKNIPPILGTPVQEAVERFIDLLDIGSITAFRSDIEDFQKEIVGLDARKKWTLCPVHNTQLGGNIIEKDALAAFNDFMQNDSSLACRQQFTVLLATNVVQPNTIDPKLTSSSLRLNRRTNIYPYENIIPNEERLNQSSLSLRSSNSSLQAVANLRTKFVRDPVTINGATVPKEIFTFVVDVSGIAKPTYIQQLMALTGGTHTSGLIRHDGPAGISVGSIDADSVLPTKVDVTKRKVLAKVAEGGIIGSVINKLECIDNDGSHKNSSNMGADDYGACNFGSDKVFGDDYYENPHSIERDSKFAFSADATSLSETLNKIINSIKQFTVTNTSPVIPGVAKPELKDRVYLSVSRPADITQRHLWQGRLAQYRYENGEVMNDDLSGIVVSIEGGGQLSQLYAPGYVWEAGSELSLRDIASDPRRVITVLEDPADGLYSGDLVDIGTLTANDFGITVDDVSSYGHHGCSDVNCLKDKIISFLQGNTGIFYDQSTANTDFLGDLCKGGNTPGKPGQCELRLGGIFHSEPKVVGSPSQFFQGINFQTFRRDYNKRPAVVYVGGNDGGLHAFHAGNYDTSEHKYDDGTGKELFFYVPPTFLRSPLRVRYGNGVFGNGETFALSSTINTDSSGNILSLVVADGTTTGEDFALDGRLGSIQDIKYGKIKDFVLDSPVFQENYAFFDGTPTIKDVFIDGYWNGIGTPPSTTGGQIESGEWHTILVSGFRNGGSGITALDITNPPSESGVAISSLPYPVHLWTFTDEDMGNSWSSPVIAKVRLDASDGTVDRWVVFVGGGIDPDATNIGSVNEGNAFYAIDLPTGELLYKFHPTRSKNTTHSVIGTSVTHPDLALHRSRMVCELASDPGVFDTNADGYADEVYIGDTCGQLWKFDVSRPLTTLQNATGHQVSLSNGVLSGLINIEATDWTGRIVFCADCDSTPADPTDYTDPANDIKLKMAHSPIYYPPVLVPDFNGDRHVVFQTGDRRYPTSNDANSKGRLYSVKSSSFISTDGSSIGSSIPDEIPTEQTIEFFREVILDNTAGDIGVKEILGIANNNLGRDYSGSQTLSGNFVVKYPGAYEKGTLTPVVSNRVLTFTSYDPTIQQSSGSICEQSLIGRSRLYQLNYATGEGAMISPTSDPLSPPQPTAGRDIGGGISSTPNISLTDNGELLLGISTSGGGAGKTINSEYNSVQLPSLSTSVREVFWQEIW